MKFILFLPLFVLFSCFLVGASPLEINLAKDSYASGETLQAEIIINSIENELSGSDINLIDENSSNVPITPFMLEIGNNYYVYFQIPSYLELGNYSFVIEDVIYYQNDLLIQGDISEDFSIVDKQSVLSVDPGIIKADRLGEQNSFDFHISNKKGSPVDVSFSTDANFISLSADNLVLFDDYTLEVYISEFLINDYGTKHLIVNYNNGSYIIPVWLGGDEGPLVNDSNESDGGDVEGEVVFLTEFDSLNKTVAKGKSEYISIEFQNKRNVSVENIVFSLVGNISEIASLEYLSLDRLNPGEIARQSIFLNKEKNALGYYNGELVLDSGYNVDRFTLSINFLEELEVPLINDTHLDEHVDIGNLEDYEPEKESEGSKIIYWVFFCIFFILVLIVLYLMYLKYQKKHRLKFPFFR